MRQKFRSAWRPLAILSVAAAVLMVAASAAGARRGHAPFAPELSSPTVQPTATAYYADPPMVRTDAIPQFGGFDKCFQTQDPTDPTSPKTFYFSCYTPADMRAIYNIPDPATSQLDGRGQTIVVVDAFGDPSIQSDLQTFDAVFGLQDPQLTVYQPFPNDPTANPADVAGWANETALDVEWAHAIAPAAHIVLAVAPSDNSRSLNDIQRRVIPRYRRAIVSLSFGNDETFARSGLIDEIGQHVILARAAMLGDTVLVAAGDYGATGAAGIVNGTATGPVAEYPASDPLVTSVGGTQGAPYFLQDPDPTHVSLSGLTLGGALEQNGQYGAEETWNEDLLGVVQGATGGAPSAFFPAPPWQASASGNTHRTVPDVAYNAAVAGGVITVVGGQPSVVGGTSAGAPQWAGIVALADQLRAAQGRPPLGFLNDDLYAIYHSPRYTADFHDILASPDFQGAPENAIAEVAGPGGSLIGFSAGQGYDLTTGLGTPNANNLIRDLAASFGARH